MKIEIDERRLTLLTRRLRAFINTSSSHAGQRNRKKQFKAASSRKRPGRDRGKK